MPRSRFWQSGGTKWGMWNTPRLTFSRSCLKLSSSNGSAPTNRAYRITPQDHTSALLPSYFSPCNHKSYSFILKCASVDLNNVFQKFIVLLRVYRVEYNFLCLFNDDNVRSNFHFKHLVLSLRQNVWPIFYVNKHFLFILVSLGKVIGN